MRDEKPKDMPVGVKGCKAECTDATLRLLRPNRSSHPRAYHDRTAKTLMRFVAVKRGKFRQLATEANAPVDAHLYALRVTRVSESDGKTYVVADASDALGDVEVILGADAFIRRAANPRFSPVGRGDGTDAGTLSLTLKLLATTKYADDIGHPAPPFVPAVGDLVDAAVRPGAFGDFGYCILVQALKPHAAKAHAAKAHALKPKT